MTPYALSKMLVKPLSNTSIKIFISPVIYALFAESFSDTFKEIINQLKLPLRVPFK